MFPRPLIFKHAGARMSAVAEVCCLLSDISGVEAIVGQEYNPLLMLGDSATAMAKILLHRHLHRELLG